MIAEFTAKHSLIGDSIWAEPALSALGEQRGEPVRLHVADAKIVPLYRHNPHITLADEPGGIELDCSRAWHWAINNSRYFGEGFFEQVGSEIRPDTRIHFKLHGTLVYPDDTIVMCPFSASCSSSQGLPPNKTMPVLWWEEVAAKLKEAMAKAGMTERVCTLGGKDEPPVLGTVNWRGQGLRLAASLILSAKVLVTVETFGCVVGSGRTNGNMIILNSATPPSLHMSPDMETRGVKVMRARFPWLWNQDEIVASVMKSMES